MTKPDIEISTVPIDTCAFGTPRQRLQAAAGLDPGLLYFVAPDCLSHYTSGLQSRCSRRRTHTACDELCSVRVVCCAARRSAHQKAHRPALRSTWAKQVCFLLLPRYRLSNAFARGA